MHLHRFYLPPSQCQGQEILLAGREAHHALDVLRLRVGQRLEVLDGVGNELLCEAREVASRQFRLAVVQRHSRPPFPCRLTLLQAVPKGKTMDLIVQKATELGVSRIVPLRSERTVPNLDDDSAEAKRDKWRQTAIEALKQCGNPWLPEIELPLTPREFLARNETFDLPLVASLQAGRRHPRACFSEFQARHQRAPASLCVWIGPEGDFTPAEMNEIKGAGALPITLGPLILRSDTAAICSISVLNYELQAAAAS